jgi:hypothetical protein
MRGQNFLAWLILSATWWRLSCPSNTAKVHGLSCHSQQKVLRKLLFLRGGADSLNDVFKQHEQSVAAANAQASTKDPWIDPALNTYVPTCLATSEEYGTDADERRPRGQNGQGNVGKRLRRHPDRTDLERMKQRVLSRTPHETEVIPAVTDEFDSAQSQVLVPEVDMSVAKLTPEQEAAIELVRSGRSIFLTGSAGTGKSYVLRHVIAELKKRHGSNRVHVTASTGSAAVLIGGITVHSFAGVGHGHGSASELSKRVHANKACVIRWRRAKALVIDEISMIDAELFQKLDMIAQRVRDNIRPFGGLQLVLSGDFFQLPPVSAGGCKFAFESEAWDRAVDAIIELKRVMRQGDDVFVRILNEIRWGNLTAASYGKLLECQRKAPASRTSDGVQDTKLHPYNVNVRAENEKRLQQLQGDSHLFVAEDSVLDANGKRLQPVKAGKAPSSAPRQDTLVARLDNLNVDRTIALKVHPLSCPSHFASSFWLSNAQVCMIHHHLCVCVCVCVFVCCVCVCVWHVVIIRDVAHHVFVSVIIVRFITT